MARVQISVADSLSRDPLREDYRVSRPSKDPALSVPWEGPTRGSLVRMKGEEILDIIPFQFNPTEQEMSILLNWREGDYPGAFLPPTALNNYGNRTIALDLFFASPVYGDIERFLAKLELAASPSIDYASGSTRAISPGVHRLILNPFSVLSVVIESMVISRKQFDRSLNATRADVNCTFRIVTRRAAEQVAYVEALRRRAYTRG